MRFTRLPSNLIQPTQWSSRLGVVVRSSEMCHHLGNTLGKPIMGFSSQAGLPQLGLAQMGLAPMASDKELITNYPEHAGR